MKKEFVSIGMLVATLLLAACSGDSGINDPDPRIDSVDALLAEICEEAALCPDISPTQQEIDTCPANVRSGMDAHLLDHLEQVTSYTSTQQVCLLACTGRAICGGFEGSLSALSDADAVEPLMACELECL